MITESDLMEAIAECQGTRNPNANTCIKLAAYYTIRDHMSDDRPVVESYSFASPPPDQTIKYEGNSEFARLISDRSVATVLGVFDELMDTLAVLNPNLYNGVMRKLE